MVLLVVVVVMAVTLPPPPARQPPSAPLYSSLVIITRYNYALGDSPLLYSMTGGQAGGDGMGRDGRAGVGGKAGAQFQGLLFTPESHDLRLALAQLLGFV
ncbi:hypothetical protein E2C01_074052 [Portunus trituberculatus]|uniref:Uncharacterized protein n=1 Tax=Portunus trituberculatus TaxID=210409 RepID=A0A5B7IB58_PORTR|nr:hypothetical protein [Portunus trituberculatus]